MWQTPTNLTGITRTLTSENSSVNMVKTYYCTGSIELLPKVMTFHKMLELFPQKKTISVTNQAYIGPTRYFTLMHRSCRLVISATMDHF